MIIEQKYCEKDMERSVYPKKHEHDRVDTLLARMGALEDNIKRTQDNEAKLMNIVKELAARRGEYDEQPTIIRSSAKFVPQDEHYQQQTPH